jgi:catechol 2,3-dioxygenase-like lactoylglutathione lyase family enzyme
MKIQDVDHVGIPVKGTERTIAFFSKLLGIEFEETLVPLQFGMRMSLSRPDGQIELLLVGGRIKATECPPVVRDAA